MGRKKTDLDLAIEAMQQELAQDRLAVTAKEKALDLLYTKRAELQNRRNQTKD